MADLIDRVTSGRIFKQIADYAFGKKDVSTQPRAESRNSSIFQDSENCLTHQTANANGTLLEEIADLDSINIESAARFQEETSTAPQEKNEEAPENVISHIPSVKYMNGTEKPPLIARYPEVFAFVDKENEVSTGLALTKVMVWQFNAAYLGEQKITGYVSRFNSAEEQLGKIDSDILEINSQLADLPDDFQNYPVLLQAVTRGQMELEELAQHRGELIMELQHLEKEIGKLEEEIRYAKNQLFLDMKDTLAVGGLLEPFIEEVRQETAPMSANNVTMLEPQPPIAPNPTPSESESVTQENARERVLEDITQKTILVQNAQERFDNLQNHYYKQYDNFIAGLEAGTVTASKSEFDAAMLLDSREATTMLIQAEYELEHARDYARELGIELVSYDQESCFADCPDDGYRESLENQWIDHVDRDHIEQWMEREDTPQEAECDAWESKTVDISDSVSAIADTFKSRKRIDRWRVMCERLEMDTEMDVD